MWCYCFVLLVIVFAVLFVIVIILNVFPLCIHLHSVHSLPSFFFSLTKPPYFCNQHRQTKTTSLPHVCISHQHSQETQYINTHNKGKKRLEMTIPLLFNSWRFYPIVERGIVRQKVVHVTVIVLKVSFYRDQSYFEAKILKRIEYIIFLFSHLHVAGILQFSVHGWHKFWGSGILPVLHVFCVAFIVKYKWYWHIRMFWFFSRVSYTNVIVFLLWYTAS